MGASTGRPAAGSAPAAVAAVCGLVLVVGLLRATVPLPQGVLVVGVGATAARLVLAARGRWSRWPGLAVLVALAGCMAAPRLPAGSAAGGAWLASYTGVLCLLVHLRARRATG